MGFLDGVLGGVVGAGVTHMITGAIEKHGGLSGLVAAFEKQGMGGVVQSWIGKGENLPVSADQLQHALGGNVVSELAAKFGLNSQDLLQKLAHALPNAVDKMTPDGTLPKA